MVMFSRPSSDDNSRQGLLWIDIVMLGVIDSLDIRVYGQGTRISGTLHVCSDGAVNFETIGLKTTLGIL